MRRKQSLYWNFHDRDIAFLRDVGLLEMKLVAQKHKLASSGSAQQTLSRIRLRITRCQNYVNAVRSLQASNSRIRKKTTSDEIPRKQQLKGFMEETELHDAQEEVE